MEAATNTILQNRYFALAVEILPKNLKEVMILVMFQALDLQRQKLRTNSVTSIDGCLFCFIKHFCHQQNPNTIFRNKWNPLHFSLLSHFTTINQLVESKKRISEEY